MIEFIRKDYRRSVWLIRIVLVFAVSFGLMFDIDSSMVFLSMALTQFTRSYLYNLVFAIIIVIIIEFITTMVVRFALSYAKIYNLPRHELILFAMFFQIPYYLILGVLNLTYYFVPFFFMWGSMLFGLIASIPCFLFFFKTINKLYLNAQTSAYFYKVIMIVYLIIYGIKLLLTII